MHPYRVKDSLWVLILAMVVVISLLAGCSSTPREPIRPYCHTSQEIRKQNNETVSSETVVKCNDDPVEQMVIRKAGVATNCGQFKNRININGRYREEIGIACQKFDGTWEVMPHPSLLR